ncbi:MULTISPECIES: ABC transporter ATP-binding protein [Streptomyces violaceusniger group]|uniref:ABC transporter ATP-binding protein n=2 Tax=Streptomyces rhizosphaericus TaxID=114699 RepID=A0ABN1RZU0_9ACTN|nr:MULTISPECIES: ABC transporter ATP-binding protein [Streptomyces violaceusniger group]
MMIRAVGPDPSVTKQKIKAGTAKRIVPYTRPYRVSICLLLLMTVANAAIVVAVPILFKYLIDNGIAEHDSDVVVGIAVAVGGLAVLGALLGFGEAWYSARVSEGLVYELRTKVFDHVQRQPLAFFTRAQTGALVSRLNADVVGAQQALTSLLSTVVSAALTLLFVLITMFYLSWVITLISLVVLPFFILPGKVVGRRLQRLMRSQMEQNAEMGALMNERFNVTGALLTKLYGRPSRELRQFTKLAGKVRDLGVLTAVNGKLLFLSMVLLSALATAVVYGVGGRLVIDDAFEIGTLVALATLLTRLFGPINQLSSAQANVVTALVSFDRLFEILDLKPLISEKPDAIALPRDGAPEIVFDGVSFSYPAAADVSLASLESIAIPRSERTRNDWTLRELSFRLPAGKLTALVGPSGAGKTTITHLVPRLYDPGEGTVSIDGHDLRDLTLESLYDTIGVVTQDAYLFHTTIGDNLRYARPEATEQEMIDACKAAQIWGLIESLPDGFDTVVGDRGYRLSGGEKQRIAMARLLLKAPPVVVLDEATAHLDSESEAALQRALETALAGRTSLVIAHRLSTIRDADQILVIDGGRVRESGTHEELLALGGLYAELYRTQFAGRGGPGGHEASPNGHGPVPPHGHGPVGNGHGPGPHGHAPVGPPHGPYPAGPGAGPFPGPGPGPAPFPGPGPHPGMRAMPGGPPPGHG